MGALFQRQLAVYASYHRDPHNRATHFIGIPAIVFSLLVPFALWRIPVGGLDLSAAWLVAAAEVAIWVVLDWSIGLAMLVVMVPMLLVADWIGADFPASATWLIFVTFFVVGWAFQLVGHHFEGRRPALVDNLFQAVIGPMFIMAETLLALGLRRDLKPIVEDTQTVWPESFP